MGFASLFNKFGASSRAAKRLYVLVQLDAIYLATDNTPDAQVMVFPIESNWESTLERALSTLPPAKRFATVVFCSQYYQTFQVDKPAIPQEEWATALPFLLKDLITERVTDIVADAYPIADGKKIQAYVFSKAHLIQLIKILEKSNSTLLRVVPEDNVWGYVQTDQQNFMLLCRGAKDGYKVSAYVNHQNRFQRALRGMVPPLTGVASSELQLDSIALELQRSSDYLSSQLRDSVINMLLVCCDEEETQTLVDGLAERLSIRVAALHSEEEFTCGQTLIQTLAYLPDGGINLYPAHLKPKKEWFTLTNVVASWAILSVLMVGYYGFISFELSAVENSVQAKIRDREQLQAEFERLSVQAAANKVSPNKVTAAERLAADIEAKKATLKAISQFDESLQEGYSGVMTSLAELGRNDISITSIELNGHVLNLKGLARTPSSVPKWVKQFNSELSLVGRTFETLNIGRNKEDIVTFELVTDLGTETATAAGVK